MDEFQPSLPERKATVADQILECKRIIWRNELEARIEKETGSGNHVQAETEFNNKQIKDKLSVLVKIQAELEKE